MRARQIKGVHFDYYGQGRDGNNGTEVPDSGHQLRFKMQTSRGKPPGRSYSLGYKGGRCVRWGGRWLGSALTEP